MKVIIFLLSFLLSYAASLQTKFMELHIPLNRTHGDFAQRCDQRFLPDENCFVLMYKNHFSHESRVKAPFLLHKHLTYILYYNWIDQIPLYALNNILAREYLNSKRIFEDSLKSENIRVMLDPTNSDGREASALSSEEKELEKKRILALRKMPEKIPRIMHKFWITHQNEPYEIPDRLIDMLRQFIDELGDVKVYMWVMDANIIKGSLSVVKQMAPEKVEIKECKELLDMMSPYMLDFFYLLYNSRWLTKASDVLRMFALYHYGGIFTDLDITIKRNFMFILKYDMTVFCYKTHFSYLCEVFMMAFTKHHPAVEFFIEYWEKMNALGKKTTHIVSALDISWRMSFLYVYTVGIFNSAFKGEDNLTHLFFSSNEMKHMISHKKDSSWNKNQYGNRGLKIYLFNETQYDGYMDTLARPYNIKISHI